MTGDDYWQLKWLKWTLKKWPGTQPSPRWSKSSLLLSWRCTGIASLLQVSESPEGPNFGQRGPKHGWNIKKTTGSKSDSSLKPTSPKTNMEQDPDTFFIPFSWKRCEKIYKPPILGDENLFPHLSPAAPFPGRVAPAPHPIRPRAGWNPCAPGRWNGGMEEWWIKWSNDRFFSAISPWLRFDDRKFGSWVERDPISTCLLHAILFWDDALAKGCHLWTCGQTWRTSHSGRIVNRAEINRGRPAPGTASSSGTSRPSLPTLLAGIFVSRIVSFEGHESTCLHEWSLHQLCLVYLDLCRHWRQIKTHQNPLCWYLLSTAGDSVLQTNCIELQHEFYLVQLSNSKENCPCCTGPMHTRWATFLKLLLSGLSLWLWNDKM